MPTHLHNLEPCSVTLRLLNPAQHSNTDFASYWLRYKPRRRQIFQLFFGHSFLCPYTVLLQTVGDLGLPAREKYCVGLHPGKNTW